MYKNILHHIQYDREKLIEPYNANIIKIESNLITTYAEKVDEYILKTLYMQYLDNDVTDLFVVDKQEFKKFILKYLPVYLSEVNGK